MVMGVVEPEVLNKYQAAAQIANQALKKLLDDLDPEGGCLNAGRPISAICLKGDQLIQELAGKVYKDVKSKGVAFPTCISPNFTVCHFAPAIPINKEEEEYVLRSGDLVKIELGAHVDGYPVLVAGSKIISPSDPSVDTKESEYLKNAADLLLQLGLRLFRIGKSNQDIAKTLTEACHNLQVNFVEGVILHKLDRNDLDGLESESIVPHPSVGQVVEKYELKAGDVFILDMALTRNAVIPKPSGTSRNTVYGKLPQPPILRTKSGRALMTSVGEMAFHERGHPRIAIAEALGAKAVRSYPVMLTPNEICARTLATVMISPNGPIRLGAPPEDGNVDSLLTLAGKLRPELQALLNEPVRITSTDSKKKN